LTSIAPKVSQDGSLFEYRHVTLRCDRAQRIAELTVAAPDSPPPASAAAIREQGCDLWALRAFRELDDAICRLRLDEENIGLVLVKTRGDAANVLASDRALAENRSHWFVNEVVLLMARVLRRLDLTAKSFFAIADESSCFAGSLLELALASDRVYMKDDSAVFVEVGPLSAGALPMVHGLTRLQSRFLSKPEHAAKLAVEMPRLDTPAARAAGIPTFAPDALDWDDEVRVALEERLSLSPDALTGMEASLRFGGPESPDSKIYARLSAWQNWIFTRPNATGDQGALTLFGQPERPKFDWRRT
jgi:benzoyl-CoA-dihydrodiol lyase